MLKSLSELSYKNQKNLNDDQFKIINDYLLEKPFLILSCDKNIGFSLIQKDLYIKLANEHLLNNKTYEKISYNPLKETTFKINKELSNLNKDGHISDQLFQKLLVNKCSLGKFKIMPKLHKASFGIRPIVSSINHPTSKLCFFVDYIFKDFISNSETVLKDSQNLIQDAHKIICDQDTVLYSMDFVSLYTNIDSKHAIDTIMDYISLNFNSIHLNFY